MCQSLEIVLWDILVVIGLVLLIIWILALANVFIVATGPIIHVFLAVAILFIAVWIFVRCCNCCRGGRYGKRRTVVV
ncbi:hypothetical protein DFJ77DRAFT_513837 [Powellomyces hirtus]|nr:hypothetical protein DFJ77DRAFT_513837 [Powellomyces hirtus]